VPSFAKATQGAVSFGKATERVPSFAKATQGAVSFGKPATARRQKG